MVELFHNLDQDPSGGGECFERLDQHKRWIDIIRANSDEKGSMFETGVS